MARITQDELNNSLKPITKGNKITSGHALCKATDKISYLDPNGLLVDFDSPQILGKIVSNLGNDKFYLKMNLDNNLYHLGNMFYTTESLRRASQSGLEPYKIVEVTKDCFNIYQQFLFTKNPAFLTAAQKFI